MCKCYKTDTPSLAKSYVEIEVEDIVAVYDAQPKRSKGFVPFPDGFANSCDIIEASAKFENFYMLVGAQSTKHPETGSIERNVEKL